ncbi:hypothetical protein [Bacillus sp. 179-C3.3 HS]|uniref:hypothetical protein n=1 Tax=Bacillus sp. 179-C3.3 HS TaxID=3232162 RepID=UPI0039A1C38F
MLSAICMVLLALCVLGAGFLTLKRELVSEPPVFASKKEAKDGIVSLFQDRGFFYLTGIALFMQIVFKQARIVPFDVFQAFLASSGIQSLFYLINRKDLGIKAGLVLVISFIFLFF